MKEKYTTFRIKFTLSYEEIAAIIASRILVEADKWLIDTGGESENYFFGFDKIYKSNGKLPSKAQCLRWINNELGGYAKSQFDDLNTTEEVLRLAEKIIYLKKLTN